MKQTFEDIVRENTPWIYRYVRSKVTSREAAEDLTQEVWLRAFRAYDNYIEDGRLRRWLMRIAQNTVRSYFPEPVIVTCVSLDDSDDESDPLYNFLADEDFAAPEEVLIRRELVSDVLAAIEKLPEKHRMVMTYRFIYDMSVGETAKLMQIPEGSVKSTAYYAIEKIRKELKIKENTTKKGDHTMECKDAYKYLFMYALGKLDAGKRGEIKSHLDSCAECRKVVEALNDLIPRFKDEKETYYYFQIAFPEQGVMYSGWGKEFDDYRKNNELLERWNHIIPDDCSWYGSGYHKRFKLVGCFDNEGKEIEVRNDGEKENVYFFSAKRVERMYSYNWVYHTFVNEKWTAGSSQNQFGIQGKCFSCQAVPADCKNLKMIRGNGFITAGKTTFAYVERYIVPDENVILEYTFE